MVDAIGMPPSVWYVPPLTIRAMISFVFAAQVLGQIAKKQEEEKAKGGPKKRRRWDDTGAGAAEVGG